MTTQQSQEKPAHADNSPVTQQEETASKSTKPTRKHHHLYENINMSENTINWIIAVLIALLLIAFYFALQNK